MEDGEGAQLGEGGDVEAVVVVDALEKPAALGTGETEDVHRGEVHAPQVRQKGGLGGFEHMGMGGAQGDETAGLHVEPATGTIALEIGSETQKAHHMQQKDQMKIGEAALTGVEPLHGALHIAEERTGVGLQTHGIVEELGEEEGDGALVRMARDGGQRHRELCRTAARNARRCIVPRQVEQRQGRKQGVTHGGTPRPRHTHHKRHHPRLLGQDLADKGVVAVTCGMEHNGALGDQHKSGWFGAGRIYTYLLYKSTRHG